MKKSNLVLLLMVIGALGYFAWTQYAARREAENKLGLDASRIVSAHFTNRAQLKVGELAGEVTVRGTDKGFLGVLSSETVAVLPFSVNYFMDVSRLGTGSYRWDGKTRTVTIDVPDVMPAKPNIDETAARVQQKGVFISRRASVDLARQVSQRAEARSMQEARRPEHLNKARENARAVLTRMASGPLAAAGIDDVRVAVSFPWEPKSATGNGEQMDRSRRIEDVLEERANQAR
ncbi:MAG TPA: DUF4230 domain-containing protein [Allosphingosinicella sp.]|jgi:hypothetical protein